MLVADKPNFLVLMADQMAARALPFHGGAAKAPTLARLAREGVVFDAAYCNSPLCAPSRFAFMSGQLPSAIEAFDNACEFAADIPTFAHYLRTAGYRAILSGKMHFVGPDQLHGFEERLTTDIYPADFSWTPDWTAPADRPAWYHSMDSVRSAGPCVRTNQLDYDEEVVFATRRRLFDLARRPDGRPFCMVMSLTHPHDPFAIPRSYWDLYGDHEVPSPALARDDVADDPHSQRLRHVCAIDSEPVTDAQVRAARRAYHGAISFVDDQIAAVLETLEETGLAGDTIVLLVGDHGEMLGERGLWYKMNFFEDSARVPMVIHAPGRFAPGRVAEPVSLVDVLPTLLDLAGTAPPADAPPLAGRSLVPDLTGSASGDTVLSEYLAEGALAPIVMIRRGSLKFIHSSADPDQLFDLAGDPFETRNLAGAPEHAGTVAAFRQEVAGRWDMPRLHADVLANQARRRVVGEALSQGKRFAWDYQPPRDAAQEYIRAHMDLEELEALARFPRVDRQ